MPDIKPTAATSATEADLREAIIAVIGESRFDAIESTSGLIAAHERACRAAFLTKLEGPHIDLLREMMLVLDRNNRYPFYA